MSATAELRPDSESPKRQLVLDAAASLFMAHGYGAVSMDAVARAAGVSKATLYAYFSSKDQLFATIIGEACRQKIALAELLPADATDRAGGARRRSVAVCCASSSRSAHWRSIGW